jgi:hypothetical protein
MPIDDFLDPAQESRRLKKAQQRAWVSGGSGGGGDSTHPGSGADSVQLGPDASAAGNDSVAIGNFPIVNGSEAVGVGASAYVTGSRAVGIGPYATVEYDNSTALGNNAGATAAWQIMLGTSFHTVVVPGTFSDPSARRLKKNVEPAPVLTSVFPELFEWEYIEGDGRRRIGPMADDLVGTDAERFLVLDDDGEPAGIDKTGLHTAQIAALLARIERLENELRERHG